MTFQNRLKALRPTVDFALMVQELKEEGYTLQQISDITGAKLSTIQLMNVDSVSSAQGWNECISLCDMYLRVTNKTTLPFI